jgi:hypothetical protein
MAQMSAFPPPPDLARQYTDENIAAGRVLPPPPPIQGHYVIFGEEHNTEEDIIRVCILIEMYRKSVLSHLHRKRFDKYIQM